MKNVSALAALIMLFPLFTLAQQRKGVIVKTDLVGDVIGQNPNLRVEKDISPTYSLKLGAVWMRRDRASNGGENSPKRYRDSKGFAVSLAARRYLCKDPGGMSGYYLSTFARYNSTTIDNLEQNSSTSGIYQRTIQLYRRGPEAGLLLGRQFIVFKHMAIDLNAGFGHYWRSHRETLLAGQPHADYVNGVYNTRFRNMRPHGQVSIGWLIK